MKHIVSRSDVAKEDVIFLRNKGLTINQIAEKLDCGRNETEAGRTDRRGN